MRNLSLFPITGVSVRRTADWLSLRDLNDLEELIETGFVIPEPGHLIRLHPMMQEIALADLKPSVTKCRTLLTNLQQTCLAYGIDVTYFKQLFQTIENIVTYIDNDDPAFYLRFLEDAFPYMEKYRYLSGMEVVVLALEVEVTNYGTNEDRALLLDYRAALEEKPQKVIKYEKDALALIPEINAENALLVSNLHSNLGGLYAEAKQYTLAAEHMETGIHIMERYPSIPKHDLIAQVTNYAMLLCNTKQPEKGFAALQKLEQGLQSLGQGHSADHMTVLEAMGSICLNQGKIPEGTRYMQQALAIYEDLCGDDPDMIEAKKQEIMQTYMVAGANIALQLKGGS